MAGRMWRRLRPSGLFLSAWSGISPMDRRGRRLQPGDEDRGSVPSCDPNWGSSRLPHRNHSCFAGAVRPWPGTKLRPVGDGVSSPAKKDRPQLHSTANPISHPPITGRRSQDSAPNNRINEACGGGTFHVVAVPGQTPVLRERPGPGFPGSGDRTCKSVG